jgi:hypothetical protein
MKLKYLFPQIEEYVDEPYNELCCLFDNNLWYYIWDHLPINDFVTPKIDHITTAIQ